MISISKQKQIFLPKISKYMEEKGYKYESNGEDKFSLNDNNRIVTLGIHFSTKGNSGNSLSSITFKSVENIILNIGLPNIKIDSTNIPYYPTIYDKSSEYSYTDKPVKVGKGIDLKRLKVENEKDVLDWINSFIHYMENEGAAFINTYSYLPNVLNRLNELEDQGEKNYLKILLGGIDHLFRALIISRLCNDPRYEDKIERFDSIILQPKYEKWHSYYHKLKEELKSKDPIYNVGL